MAEPVRIPAEVERDDRVLANLTARQLAIVAVTAAVLYGGWVATRAVLPALVYAVIAVPIGVAVTAVALGSRDGIGLDRLLLAAIKQRLAPRRLVASSDTSGSPAPDWLTAHESTDAETVGDLRLPAEDVSDAGVVDLGADGIAAIAAVTTVNFALRTPTEQETLVATFARLLHSLTSPVQILIRAERLDLSGQIIDLRETAGGLPHPALETAALEHAGFLTELAEQSDLLRRQVLLVLREPLHGPDLAPRTTTISNHRRANRASHGGVSGPESPAYRAAELRLARRLTETGQLLAPAGLAVVVLDAGQATAVLAAACNPDHLIAPRAGLAGADEVITTAASDDDLDEEWAA